VSRARPSLTVTRPRTTPSAKKLTVRGFWAGAGSTVAVRVTGSPDVVDTLDATSPVVLARGVAGDATSTETEARPEPWVASPS
jgi:hypothetical protein